MAEFVRIEDSVKDAIVTIMRYVKGITGVAVKQGLGRETARCLPSPRAQQAIREGAAKAVSLSARTRPLRLLPPYQLVIRLYAGQSIDEYLLAGAKRLDSRTVLLRAANISDLPI